MPLPSVSTAAKASCNCASLRDLPAISRITCGYAGGRVSRGSGTGGRGVRSRAIAKGIAGSSASPPPPSHPTPPPRSLTSRNSSKSSSPLPSSSYSENSRAACCLSASVKPATMLSLLTVFSRDTARGTSPPVAALRSTGAEPLPRGGVEPGVAVDEPLLCCTFNCGAAGRWSDFRAAAVGTDTLVSDPRRQV
eukprot:scaffold38922_cov42-Phaeocystis_antarctica.AAC.1